MQLSFHLFGYYLLLINTTFKIVAVYHGMQEVYKYMSPLCVFGILRMGTENLCERRGSRVADGRRLRTSFARCKSGQICEQPFFRFRLAAIRAFGRHDIIYQVKYKVYVTCCMARPCLLILPLLLAHCSIFVLFIAVMYVLLVGILRSYDWADC